MSVAICDVEGRVCKKEGEDVHEYVGKSILGCLWCVGGGGVMWRV